MQRAIPCMVFRGGTSKGLYFLAQDLPAAEAERAAVLLALMGSPDKRQIDGMGGAHPLTSKVAVVSPSTRPDCDVDYLFLQVAVDKAEVSAAQNCGNILAGVGPFAIEAGLVAAAQDFTEVRIHMRNTGARATARVQTPGGAVQYAGDARIAGVPGTAAPVAIEFLNIAGSSCGALLPTGRVTDEIDGAEVSCIDNGMPVVLLRAADFGIAGGESPQQLEADRDLKARIERIRRRAGEFMNLGDVSARTVPKMSLLSAPTAGGAISTRTFIPHRVHDAIGVLGSVGVATACLIPGSVAHGIAVHSGSGSARTIQVEHPSGSFDVEFEVHTDADTGEVAVHRAALLRTARLLMRGAVLSPQWPGDGARREVNLQ